MKRDLLLLLAAAVAGCAPRHTITGHIDNLTNDSLCIVHCAIEDMPGLKGDDDQRITYDTIVATAGRFVYDTPVERPTQFIIIPMQLMEFDQGRRHSTSTSDMKLFLDKGEQVKIEGRIDSTVSTARFRAHVSTKITAAIIRNCGPSGSKASDCRMPWPEKAARNRKRSTSGSGR